MLNSTAGDAMVAITNLNNQFRARNPTRLRFYSDIKDFAE